MYLEGGGGRGYTEQSKETIFLNQDEETIVCMYNSYLLPLLFQSSLCVDLNQYVTFIISLNCCVTSCLLLYYVFVYLLILS